MTIEEFKEILNDKSMQSKETNIQVYKNGKNKITFKEFYDQFLEFAKEQQTFNKTFMTFMQDQQKFNQYVLDMFKKHKWI